MAREISRNKNSQGMPPNRKSGGSRDVERNPSKEFPADEELLREGAEDYSAGRRRNQDFSDEEYEDSLEEEWEDDDLDSSR